MDKCECCGQLLPESTEEFEDEDSMIFLKGSSHSFHCDNPIREGSFKSLTCGCNVFRKSKTVPYHYKCNACGSTFTGEV